jgi:phosphatidylserine decarboxylase
MSVASLVVATSLRALPRKRLSRLLGRMARVEGPDAMLRAAIRVYCRAYRVDLADYDLPPAGFRSFDEFFTRSLRPGARPVDPDPDTLISPADGRVEAAGPIEPGASFQIKGHRYEIAELIDDRIAGATDFEGGWYALIYLAPGDYHRVHAPVTGAVRALRHVPGTLFPVNALGLNHVPKLFARNERVVVHQRSDRFGDVATVMVGAIGVGRISMSFDDSVITNDRHAAGLRVYGERAPILRRGDELGTFHMGSTVVVLAPPSGRMVMRVAAGERVRMGAAIAQRSG